MSFGDRENKKSLALKMTYNLKKGMTNVSHSTAISQALKCCVMSVRGQSPMEPSEGSQSCLL